MIKNTKLILEALGIAVRHYCNLANNSECAIGERKADKLRDRAWEFEAIADAISNETIKVVEVEE